MARILAPRKIPGADDFEILFLDSSVSVGSIVYAIHEYTLTEGVRFGEVGKAALESHAQGNSAQLIFLIAANCGCESLAIAGLSDEALAVLIDAYTRANRSWFLAATPMPGKKSEHWSSVMQALIAHGHTIDAIRTYTLRQVNLFHEAIGRLHSRERHARVVDINLGFAGGDEANDLLKKLKKASE
jgi:hypothetical protein